MQNVIEIKTKDHFCDQIFAIKAENACKCPNSDRGHISAKFWVKGKPISKSEWLEGPQGKLCQENILSCKGVS